MSSHEVAAPGSDIADWTGLLNLEANPVFCGRSGVVSQFLELLGRDNGAGAGSESKPGGRTSTLIICADADAHGIGKTRLLKELGLQARRDGHLPVLIGGPADTDRPRNPRDLCTVVARGLLRARDALRLPDAGTGRLWLLGEVLDGRAPCDRLEPVLAQKVSLGMRDEAIRDAVRDDAWDLLADARIRHPGLTGGPVLLFDDLDRGSTNLLTAMLDGGLLGDGGFGEGGRGDGSAAVPVVAVVAVGPEAGIPLDLREGRYDHLRWLAVTHLRRFDPATREDLHAYEQVMLHPFARTVPNQYTDRPYVFNPSASIPAQRRDLIIGVWRQLMDGLPAKFLDPAYTVAIEAAAAGDVVIAAETDDVTG